MYSFVVIPSDIWLFPMMKVFAVIDYFNITYLRGKKSLNIISYNI